MPNNHDWGVEMTMTPAKPRKACDKLDGVYAMARLFGKGHLPQYLYRRTNRKVAISQMDSLAIRKAIEHLRQNASFVDPE